MRTVTGLIGKRGNQNAYRIGTATATIGIRGSTGDTMVCNPNCDGFAKGAETLPSGTHHQTHSGSYTMQIDDKMASGETGRNERVYLVQAMQNGAHTVMTDEPANGGRVFVAQAGSKVVVIEDGHTGLFERRRDQSDSGRHRRREGGFVPADRRRPQRRRRLQVASTRIPARQDSASAGFHFSSAQLPVRPESPEGA